MKLFNKLLDFKNYNIKTKILMPFVIICILVGLGMGSYIVSTKMYSSKSDTTKKEALVLPKDDAKKNNINTTNSIANTNSTNEVGQNNTNSVSNNTVGNSTNVSNSGTSTSNNVNSSTKSTTDNNVKKTDNNVSTQKQSTQQNTQKVESKPKQEVTQAQTSQPVSKPTDTQQIQSSGQPKTTQPVQQTPSHGNTNPNYNPNQNDNSVGGGVNKERAIAELQQKITTEKHRIDTLQNDPRGQDHNAIQSELNFLHYLESRLDKLQNSK